MAILQVDREAILSALSEFDKSCRGIGEWTNWESNRAQVWVLEYDGKLYPPKKILSIATGAPVSSFNGGPESNDYLATRGFEVRRLRDATLGETFSAILERYRSIRATQAFGGNKEARELFGQARRILESWVELPDLIRVVASYGKGNWAAVPWISLLDVRETRTTQDGTYVVYLFCEDGRGVYIKLAQGVTKVEQEFGARAASVLEDRATAFRARCHDLALLGFDLTGKTDLGTSHRLAKLYESSTIASKFYARDAIPPDEQLLADLTVLLSKYKDYVDEHVHSDGVAADTRRLSLIGTWRNITSDLPDVKASIDRNGSWASWWSFPIKEEAMGRLSTPFFLYAYEGDGRIAARIRVDEMVTSRGSAGIESPWPSVTRPEWLSIRRLGDKQSEVFKTWFRVGAIELLTPARSIDDFELALGLSTPESVLNQNTFGYVIEDQMPSSTSGVSELGPPASVSPPLALDWLVERTGARREVLQEMIDTLLGPSPQIMLAGPPGTSKTWLARQIALYLANGQAAQTRFVQFHPTYSYESFIEGLRPVVRSGGVTFELTPGVVVDVVREMQRRNLASVEGAEFVVVIDEANRANLPRVLGELMFLFEYREQTVRLQYSADFALPRNLRFIGTMNTADRSIRSIDVALRRRFDVFELGPDPELLERYYASNASLQIVGLIDGFIELNQALSTNLDRHHTIGHAFFMRPVMNAPTLKRVWNRRVFPLVEEFFFDQPDLAKEFSLERFWPESIDVS